MDFLSAALDLIQLGFKIFPIAAGEKVPAIKGGRGFKDAVDDEGIIEAWSRDYPNANVGVACGEVSGIIVVDIDPRNGGMETVRSLRQRGFELPPTISVFTPSGGVHGYYRYQDGLSGSRNPLGAGIDVQSNGKYVVAPPSRLSDGRGYSWRRAPFGDSFPPLPQWVVKRLTPPKPTRTPFYEPVRGDPGDLTGPMVFLETMTAGERNKVLFWAACRAGDMMRKGEISETEAISQLMAAGARAGLDQGEMPKTIRSGIRKGISGQR